MVVAPTSWDQIPTVGDATQLVTCLVVVLTVIHLDAAKADGNETGDHRLDLAGAEGMGEDRNAAGTANQRDGLLGLDLGPWDEARATGTQKAIEGFTKGADVPSLDEGAGDVGASYRALAGKPENMVAIDRIAVCGEALEDALHTNEAVLGVGGKASAELGIVAVDEVAEEMDLSIAVVASRAELNARNDLQTKTLPLGDSFSETVNRVVVGQAKDSESSLLGLAHQSGGAKNAVGEAGVGMKVNRVG